MPKIQRPGYERIELYLPAALARAVQRAARGQSVTTWAAAALAKAAGVEYTPPTRGRPRKDAAK